jgi:hypothetical protein
MVAFTKSPLSTSTTTLPSSKLGNCSRKALSLKDLSLPLAITALSTPANMADRISISTKAWGVFPVLSLTLVADEYDIVYPNRSDYEIVV